MVTRHLRSYCSQACADQFGPGRVVHFQHPAWPDGREACGSWTSRKPRVTAVAADVECGNCKQTLVWKKAIAA